jgi:hypothetical protein
VFDVVGADHVYETVGAAVEAVAPRAGTPA